MTGRAGAACGIDRVRAGSRSQSADFRAALARAVPVRAYPGVVTLRILATGSTPPTPRRRWAGHRNDAMRGRARTRSRGALTCAPTSSTPTSSSGCATWTRRAGRSTCATASSGCRQARLRRHRRGAHGPGSTVAHGAPLRSRPPDPLPGGQRCLPALRPQPRNRRIPGHRHTAGLSAQRELSRSIASQPSHVVRPAQVTSTERAVGGYVTPDIEQHAVFSWRLR